MKKLQPLPQAALDYVWAVKMMSAPWLLGAVKAISFPVMA